MAEASRAAAAAAVACWLLSACATAPDREALARQVADTERAFARSMADRDHAAFVALLSEQAVFIHGPSDVLRGRAAVAAGWKPFFQGTQAPFSWDVDSVELLADGTLAHTSGPVRDPQGRLTLRFNSVWRQEAPGVWRIVFDKGQPLTESDRQAEAERAPVPAADHKP